MEEKVQQAIELSREGLTRQEIADRLYTSPDKKNRLSGLRKLMGRHGFVWDVASGIYTNKNKQQRTNKIVSTVPPTSEQAVGATLTQEEVSLLKELALFVKTDYEGLQEALRASEMIVATKMTHEAPKMEFTAFEGVLQGSTMQLYDEVWKGLEDFKKATGISKKTIVNEVIWEFIKKF